MGARILQHNLFVFSCQRCGVGEMGGTIINHPGSYLKVIKDIKKAWTSPAALRTGVTFFAAYTPGQIIRGPGVVTRRVMLPQLGAWTDEPQLAAACVVTTAARPPD